MQIFPRSFNLLPAILGLGLAVGGGAATAGVWYYFTPKHTHVGYAPRQPVPYSHWLHAGQLGMDCRYCHANVERSPEAMIPPTQTCMNCHAQVRLDSGALAPVRESWCAQFPPAQRTDANCPGVPAERRARLTVAQAAIPWVRVHRLPDHAYFDHSVHVTAGVGCVECHGRVDRMEVVRQEQPLSMGWCLDCHRDPTGRLRPPSEVTNMNWEPSGPTQQARPVRPPQTCSGCHR
ncbi:MAG: cytochrome c3 family protein [Deltaproteobacteria bacterium]|nr:cytochrome c3 family protein [Deltaproteobacteria bacterium]